MADQKITELDALTVPADADVLPIVDDPAVAPATKKITWANIKLTLFNLVNLAFPPAADETPSGLIISVEVATNAEGIGAPLFIAADGEFDTADASASTTSPAVVLALEEGTGAKKVLLHGILRQDAWDWTIGPGKLSLIYLNTTTGELTQTQPSGTDEVVQPVGWALSADVIYFCPSLLYFTHT